MTTLPPPPRRVSTVLAGQLLFGGETGFMFWVVLIVGSGTLWLFRGRPDMLVLIVVPIAFTLVGVGGVIFGIRKGARAIRALRAGKTATATLVSDTRTGTTIGTRRRRVHELRYSFSADDGTTHEFRARTAWPERISAKHQEILYEASNPSNAAVIKLLPPLVVDENGSITASPSPAILGPVLAIAVNAIGIYSCLR